MSSRPISYLVVARSRFCTASRMLVLDIMTAQLSVSFPSIEMPARIDQLIAAPNKDFRAASALRYALSVHLDFTKVGRVDDDRVTVNLHLRFRKVQPH